MPYLLANQETGFYMITASVMKELNVCSTENFGPLKTQMVSTENFGTLKTQMVKYQIIKTKKYRWMDNGNKEDTII